MARSASRTTARTRSHGAWPAGATPRARRGDGRARRDRRLTLRQRTQDRDPGRLPEPVAVLIALGRGVKAPLDLVRTRSEAVGAITVRQEHGIAKSVEIVVADNGLV